MKDLTLNEAVAMEVIVANCSPYDGMWIISSPLMVDVLSKIFGESYAVIGSCVASLRKKGYINYDPKKSEATVDANLYDRFIGIR